jgi:hypothetical protein
MQCRSGFRFGLTIAAWATAAALFAAPSRASAEQPQGSAEQTRDRLSAAVLKLEVVAPAAVNYARTLFHEMVFSSRLTNLSDMPISVITIASGALCPSSVKRNGKVVRKHKRTVSDLVDQETEVGRNIRMLPPGESVEIVFSGLKCRPLGQDVETYWECGGPGRYSVRFEYSVVDDGSRLSALSNEVTFNVVQ